MYESIEKRSTMITECRWSVCMNEKLMGISWSLNWRHPGIRERVQMSLTSESAPLSTPGQAKLMNSWHRLWTTSAQTRTDQNEIVRMAIRSEWVRISSPICPIWIFSFIGDFPTRLLTLTLKALFTKTPTKENSHIDAVRPCFDGNLPDEISAMRTKCWCFEKARNELMFFNSINILLTQCTPSSNGLFLLHERRGTRWSSRKIFTTRVWRRGVHWKQTRCCSTSSVQCWWVGGGRFLRILQGFIRTITTGRCRHVLLWRGEWLAG